MTDPQLLGPRPGAALTERQAQRVTALALVLQLVAGRSVHIGTVMELARWIDDGSGS